MPRRNDLDICAEILQLSQKGANKTRIVYGANLNFKIVEKYLSRLIANGLLKLSSNRRFTTTEKGVQFLEQFQVLVAPIQETKMIEEVTK